MTVVVHLVGDITLYCYDVLFAIHHGTHYVVQTAEKQTQFERSKLLYVELIDTDDGDDDQDEAESEVPTIPDESLPPVSTFIGPTDDLRFTPRSTKSA